MAEQNITLEPGESKVVSFNATPHEARTYQVSVNGLAGSFKAIATAITISNINLNPTNLTSAKHEYETGCGLGYWGDPFTIGITFSNPFSHDVWVKPDYAFGKLTGGSLKPEGGVVSGFNPEKLIYFRLLLSGSILEGDYSETSKWQKLYDARGENQGSNMDFVYDPDGVPLLSIGDERWLKIPAGSTATTAKEAHLGGDLQVKAYKCVLCKKIFLETEWNAMVAHFKTDHPDAGVKCWAWGGLGGCYFEDGSGNAIYNTSVPAEGVTGKHDLCVVAWRALYFVYDEGWSQTRIGGETVILNWRPVELTPVAAAVPDAINITG